VKSIITVALLCLGLGGCHRAPSAADTKAQIVRETQEMFDAVAVGNKTPWQRYVADDVLYFDEKGRSMDKTALVADVEPLPKGYSGEIKIVNSKFHVEGNTTIHTYDMDESETVFGQQLHARYHATDTWMYRNGEWRIAAGQVLRYYEDPAPGPTDASKFRDYVGTYELSPGNEAVVSTEGGKLFVQRGSGAKVELIPEDGRVFFRKGVEGRRVFRYEGGKVVSMIDRRNNEDIVWKKVK
jgi:hypothetical protein